MLRFQSPVPSAKRLIIGLTIGSVAVLVAGCSSSSDAERNSATADGDLSSAQQECVDAANEFLDNRGLLPESLPEELTPLSESPPEGLTITRVTPGTPTSEALSQAIVDLAPTIGWTGKSLTYDGSIEDLNSKAMDAVNGSDVVVVDGIPSAALQTPIKAAEEKGVLFIIGSSAETPQSVPGFGATSAGGDLYKTMGELAAYAFMKATDCQGQALTVGLADTAALKTEADTMATVVERECEDCDVTYMEIPFMDVGAPAATNAVVSKLQSDASRNFVFFTFGDLAVGVEPALKQAGLDDVQVGGAIPLPSNLEQLKANANAFWLGVPQGMTAYITVDTALRALESGETYVGDHYPVPVFTPDNTEATDPIPVYPENYKEEFEKLWQVS